MSKSTRVGKKWMATFEDGAQVHFGASGSDDFTTHGDKMRKEFYLARHAPSEDWTKRGVRTAGFWARWLLWNRRSLRASAADIERRFPLSVVLVR